MHPECSKPIVARVKTKEGPIDICAKHIRWASTVRFRIEGNRGTLKEYLTMEELPEPEEAGDLDDDGEPGDVVEDVGEPRRPSAGLEALHERRSRLRGKKAKQVVQQLDSDFDE